MASVTFTRRLFSHLRFGSQFSYRLSSSNSNGKFTNGANGEKVSLNSKEDQNTPLNSLPTLTLYTKDQCSLCDVAKEVLQPHWHLFNFEEVDIEAEGNEKWWDLYCYDIPVFHLSGKFLMKHRVNTSLLLRKIKEYNAQMDA